jgi:tRNA-specific 2-thiouridylase
MSEKRNTKVIVGMSGGVDSSVAAYLLKQQGYDVSGLFMKNWEGDDTDDYCPATEDLADAKAVCTRLDIPLHTVNFSKEYADRVFSHFLAEYQAGRTPNPDILCNKEIKFKAFLEHALALGADYIATGHYARIHEQDGHFQLLKAKDNNKDQTYFLYGLTQNALKNSLFPIGHLPKPDVRALALEQQLITHDKKDSTGICFIGERKFKTFLQEYLLAQPGAIEDPLGKQLGKHDGLMFYTLGQRQGLKLGGIRGADEAPWYVVDKDVKRNVLIVAQGTEHPLMMALGLHCNQIDWIRGEPPEFPLACSAKTRYRQLEQPCLVTENGADGLTVLFSSKQRAITPGQSVVFYQGLTCLGGAVITECLR